MAERWPVAREALGAFREHGTLPRAMSWFFIQLCEPQDLMELKGRYEREILETKRGSPGRVKCRYRLDMIKTHLELHRERELRSREIMYPDPDDETLVA